MQVAYSTGSAYVYSHHIKIARAAGLSDADIGAVARDTKGEKTDLDSLSRAVLAAAREMTIQLDISDATFVELRAGLEPDQMVDLFHVIGLYNGLIRVFNATGIKVEDSYLPYLKEFPI